MPQRWAVTCKQCHGPAFVVLGDLPKLNEVVMAARCEHVDGRPLQTDDALECDTCGADFTASGVEACDCWTLMPETFSRPHEPQDTPFGAAADPTDIARVRLAIAASARPPKRQRARKGLP
jgi:hypothetical protein